MLKVLIVSATKFEIEPLLLFLKQYRISERANYFLKQIEVEICITGVGMVNTAFELGKLNGKKFDIAINAGLAGSFGKFKTGEVVNVTQDCFSELGAEQDTLFLSIDEMGFGKQNHSLLNVYENEVLIKHHLAKGITVNTVHGNEQNIQRIKDLHAADVETMEGAAFIQACNAFSWRAVQLRSISNLVEKRNKDNWNLPLAIQNLNEVLIDLIMQINK